MKPIFEPIARIGTKGLDTTSRRNSTTFLDFFQGDAHWERLTLKHSVMSPGKRILHLQCHFGLDSLSLARMGAIVTGVDFSDTAVQKACQLSEATGLDAEFHCANVYDVCDILESQSFDIVYASYGVFCWIPDLYRWFSVASAMLKPNGRVFIVDGHPVA